MSISAVCRWFAERADVILLFFDPDKPGTTGETLSILTNSLSGLEHKLHIVLNKADQLKNIHDFARAYGALCWNLSKVILRKDLPKIHTICLPSPHLNQPDKLEISTSIKPTNNDAVDKSADEISDTDQIETSDSLNTSSWSDVGEKEGDINRFSDIASPVEGLPVSVTVPTLPTNDFMHQFLDLDSAR